MQGIKNLIDVMARLRDPRTGCPWDLKQTFETIVPYTIEEAWEVADAVHRNDMDDFQEELGDLLLQVVFQSRMADEKGLFDFDAVAQAQADKLISRHPHVFGREAEVGTPEEVIAIWNRQKEKEKAEKGVTRLLDSITRGLPALMRAQKIYHKVARVGFDWETLEGVFAKLDEEVAELKQAIAEKDQAHLVEELGDILFVVGVLGGHLGIDAENALHESNNKFICRFNAVEDMVKAESKDLGSATLQQMEEFWQVVKKQEKQAA